jgi:hypothetical protein
MNWMAIIMALLQALPTLIPEVTAIIDAIIAIFNQNPTPANQANVAFLTTLKAGLAATKRP